MQKYHRKKRTLVTAVRLDLDTAGFTYHKWGGTQRCKKGDWIVNNNSDVYTIDAETFQRTYQMVETEFDNQMVKTGLYEKTGLVWAEEATESGSIRTMEGSTDYSKGDYLVFNDPDRKDGWAMSPTKFRELYEAT